MGHLRDGGSRMSGRKGKIFNTISTPRAIQRIQPEVENPGSLGGRSRWTHRSCCPQVVVWVDKTGEIKYPIGKEGPGSDVKGGGRKL